MEQIKNFYLIGISKKLILNRFFYQKFKNTLSEKGLKSIEVKAGDGFNVDFHEAVTQISAPSEELKGKIVDVIETGYQLHDKVIRFAKVVTGM